eukprot:symbB.v1.2.000938.t1/scaffold45.1/size390604/1
MGGCLAATAQHQGPICGFVRCCCPCLPQAMAIGDCLAETYGRGVFAKQHNFVQCCIELCAEWQLAFSPKHEAEHGLGVEMGSEGPQDDGEWKLVSPDSTAACCCGEDSNGMQPDVITWNTLGTGCMKRNAWPLASQCLAILTRNTLEASVATYGAATGVSSPWQHAVALRAEMFYGALSGNQISNNGVLGVCAGDGQWKFCMDQLRPFRQSSVQLDTLTFSSLS